MKQVSRSALVSFSAEQMFNLVNDVAKYPEFLPGCSALESLSLRGMVWWLLSMWRRLESAKRLRLQMS